MSGEITQTGAKAVMAGCEGLEIDFSATVRSIPRATIGGVAILCRSEKGWHDRKGRGDNSGPQRGNTCWRQAGIVVVVRFGEEVTS